MMIGKNKITKLKNHLKNYVCSTVAAAALAFGLAVPAVVTAVGVSVDMAQVYMVRERLHRALDSSALAGAATAGDSGEVTDRVTSYFDANFADDKIGEYFGLTVNVTDSEVQVAASASVDTAFMDVMGFDVVTVSAETVVVRQVRGLEIVLVLDNTGSMNTNDNIGALRTASTNFVNIIFDALSDPEHVKIGMVPYSSSVNVGPYGIGLDESGNPYGPSFVVTPDTDVYEKLTNGTTPFASNNFGMAPEDLTYDTNSFGQWQGCVLAHDYPDDTLDHEGPWEMYRYDWNGSTSSYYDNIYTSSPLITYGDYYNSFYGPNYHCPDRPIVPLTSDQDFLLDAITEMNADGFTLGNYGMVWGWRVISPEFPFVEGAEYNDTQWEKAVLMMTDGVNTMNHAYTAYGQTDDHDIGPDDENTRFAEICESMKDENILIYTVTFFSNVDEETKDFYRACATDETKFFDAPSQDDLIEVFEQISRELSSLHIAQ